MKKTMAAVTAALMVAGAVQADVLAGWNYFEPNDNASVVNDTTPDTVATGFPGNIGGNVNSAFAAVGGGERSDAGFNAFNDTYKGNHDEKSVLYCHGRVVFGLGFRK
jgi:hypothetical protein